MEKLLFSLGDFDVTVEVAVSAGVAVLAALLAALLVISVRSARERSAEALAQADQAAAARKKTAEAEKTLAHLLQVQNEMTGRMQTMAEIFGSRTSVLARLVFVCLVVLGLLVGAAFVVSLFLFFVS